MKELLQQLNWADYFIIAVVLISTLVSIIRGFVREVLSLVVWIIAFVVAFKFSAKLATVFAAYIKTPSLRVALAFALLFIITLILGGLLSFLLSHLIVKTGLSGTDRVLGMVFGFARGLLVVAVVLLLLTLGAEKHAPWWGKSLLIPHFKWLVTWLHGFLPAKLTHISKTAGQTIVAKIAAVSS